MDATKFGPNSPGTLARSPQGVHAFCPSPLPEHLSIDAETVHLLVEAENAVGRLAGTTAREFNPYLVGSPMLHREAILSSRMEGTVTTPEQLVLLEAETESPGRKPRGDADTQEVLNYVRAMQHGLELLAELPVSLRLIREVHRVLLSGTRGGSQDPGEFRRSQNFIRGPWSERIEDARFVPPPVPEMKQALSDFEKYLHLDEVADPFLIRLALIHYQFEAIHPFRDGNGRVGRLLLPLLMVSKGRLESPILYLSAFFERHRETYADLLLRVSQEGDWVSWIRFFLRAVHESAREATDQALALLDLRHNYHRRFQTGRSSARLIRLIDSLFQSPSVTIAKAAKLLDLSNQGAANNIHLLEEAGVLREVTGKKRNQVYVADGILAFFFESEDHGG